MSIPAGFVFCHPDWFVIPTIGGIAGTSKTMKTRMKSGWKEVRLGEVLTMSQSVETPQAGQLYRLLGVRLWGVGAYERETIDGSQTQYKQFTKISHNDVVVNKIWARNGSVTVVTQGELAGCYASTEFPVFKPDTDVVDPKWLYFATCQPWLWRQCSDEAFGTSGKNRIRPEKFLQVIIPLPPLAEQQRIVAKLDAVKAKLAEVERLRTQQSKDVKALLFKHYTRLIENADWLPMREVAPIIRRPVEIDPDQQYPELGIRSFGKGTFHKPPMKGSDLTWQKPFWLKAGDLVFSNIKAWEGAVAVVQPDDDGRVGSHRYISCVPDTAITSADFLFYYFQTPDGNEKLNAASPGSADRNRTLNTKKLADTLIPMPSLTEQAEFLALRTKLGQMQRLNAQNEVQLSQLMPSLLAQAFGSQ